jgi:hypothetical protein
MIQTSLSVHIHRLSVNCYSPYSYIPVAHRYSIWSIIQNVVLRYNPQDDDDDDAIYDIMKWHVIFWDLSIRGRHYQEATPTEQEEEDHVPKLLA